jgi:hypothetical protein
MSPISTERFASDHNFLLRETDGILKYTDIIKLPDDVSASTTSRKG